MKPLKRVAAINDISGFGKCSLTVSLPILSAAGVETCVMPTAILSTHTGGFEGFTYRDLTTDLDAFSSHWATLGIDFSAIYTGYLGSVEQIDIVLNIIDRLKTKDTLIVVDPVMADDGKLYKNFTTNLSNNMSKLARKADILIPNITEASLLLGIEYKEPVYEKEYINYILKALSKLGPDKIILTGVTFEESTIGAACYNKENDNISYHFSKKIEGSYHGTGDIFASFLVSAIMNDKTLEEAVDISVELTHDCINNKKYVDTPSNYGVPFEWTIPKLISKLKNENHKVLN